MKIKLPLLILLTVGALMIAACGGEDEADFNGDTGASSMNMEMPENLDTSRSKSSEGGIYEVTVTSNIDPLDLNEIHSWTVHIEDGDGNGVEEATILVDGGMPQHNHGFPTEPQITEELGGGDYLLEGVKFSMAGWWEMKLDISSKGESDSVVFNIVLN